MTVVEVLEKARRLIARKGGWGKGNGCNILPALPLGCYCADTAIHAAAGDDTESGRAVSLLRVATGFSADRDEDESEPFYRWHDAPERTVGDVLAAFDRAIALARSAP